MLLAKLALGLGGTIVLAGAYTFHDGVMRVDEDHINSKHVHVWLPAAIVPMVEMLTVRAPSPLVEVRDSNGHVSVRTHNGKLVIDVDEPGEQVHVACPLAMMDDISRELAANAPGV